MTHRSHPVQPLIDVQGLDKDYGGTQVLTGVDFTVHTGEIHALLGANGAGKSTLVKVLAGVEARSGGTVTVAGHHFSHHPTGREVEHAGLAFVHQDLGLIDTLTVAENLALPTHFPRRAGLISFKRARTQAAATLAGLDIPVDPAELVGDLEQDQKVMIAVARAFARNARAIVLDEVSASLPAPELERFAHLLRGSTNSGVGYVYVTHRLDEVFDLATRVTVLRDGRVAGSAQVKDTTLDEVVEWILGEPMPARGIRDRQPEPRRTPYYQADRGLRVEGLHGAGLEEPVSFNIRPGEIVGLCGLIGSGFRSVAQILGGAATPTGGSATLAGQTLHLGWPHALVAQGCAYVPGNRDALGAILDLSIRENLFVAHEPPSAKDGLGFVRQPRRERRLAASAVRRFGVHPSDDVERPVSTLSGGNRQKVVLGRAVRRQPQLLVLEDPTQGVDIHSRAELHTLLRRAASEGMAVLLASSDFDEIASEADRAFVMCQGRVSRELAGEDLSGESLARASYEDLRAATSVPNEVTS